MMNRRKFNRNTALAALGLPLLNLSQMSCNTPEIKPYLDEIGLQLWTVRDLLEKDPEITLRAIKELGYYQVELFDVESQIESIGPILKDLDLKTKCSHFNWTYLTDRWDLKNIEKPSYGIENVIEKANQAGVTHLIVAYLMPGEREKLDQYKALADKMNKFGAQCKSAGISLSYHNHNFEFSDLDGAKPYDILIERFDSELVKFELDVFWSSVAGVEPVALMKKMKNKINLLHLKDKQKALPVVFKTGEVPEKAFKALGQGEVDIQGVLAIAKETGVDYCHVEQDFSAEVLRDIEVSMDYLKG